MAASSDDPDFELPHRGVYFPNWAQYRKANGKFTAQDVDPTLCTYLIAAFAKIENNQLLPFEWNDEDTFRTLIGLKKQNPKLKVLLAVGGWTLSYQVAAVAASPDALRTFVTSAVVNLRKWGFDGLDIDWEFPKEEDRERFSAMLKAIRIGFESEQRQRGVKRLALTVAVHLLSLGGYDAAVINETCDIVNLMTYDLHGAWNPTSIGHHAPLFKGPFGEDSTNNVADVAKSWEDAGVAKGKIAVGLPFYGRGWNLSDPQEGQLGGIGSGPIVASRCTEETGNWPYHEIVTRIRESGAVPVYDDTVKATCVAGKDFWMGYDDVSSIKGKTAWVKANHYGGVFAWEVSQDDFAGLGGAGKFPLLCAIRDVLAGRDRTAVPRETTTSTSIPHTITQSGTGTKFHVVKPGDTAYNIASQYGMTLEQLRNLNLGKKNLELIHPGDKIAIDGTSPAAASRTGSSSVAAHVVSPSSSSSSSGRNENSVHVVQSGDTAYNIAMKYGMTLDEIRRLNPGKGTMEMIHPGDKLIISSTASGSGATSTEHAVAGPGNGKWHVVQSGDTAYNIALTNGITLVQLRALNPGRGTMEMIHPGDRIALPGGGALVGGSSSAPPVASGSAGNGKWHTVQSGDTAYNIALKNGMTLDQLRKLNPGRGTMEMIHPGDRIALG
ncbi:Acidic mammalian chitinase [Hypsibius exemplaris]|uniref:Acidic mammalian chitinase n=1 Tax=Hypsibius exemplaris TaxID=2072580 RepID=A0A1W0WKM8_HYPEX|nr:Acidic mammalian chitinase [Hypsibius exemplaris]